jgi:Voltage-dependent anion channel
METLTRPGEHATTNPPAVAFSSVMGICGLGLSWRAAGQVLAAPSAIGEWLIAVGVILFIALSVLYGIKTVRGPSIVVAEFRDPRSASNFACMTVAVVKKLESRHREQASVNPNAGEREMARLTVTGFAEHVLAGNLRQAGKLLAH